MLCFQAVDQFLLSELFFPSAVIKFEVLHDACNTSDHDPILLQLDVAIAIGVTAYHNSSGLNLLGIGQMIKKLLITVTTYVAFQCLTMW